MLGRVVLAGPSTLVWVCHLLGVVHAASAYWTIVASGIVGALMAKNRVASDESGLGPYHSHSRSSSPIR